MKRPLWRTKRSASVLLPLGPLTVSDPAQWALHTTGCAVGELLARHQLGDWGQVDDIDRQQNTLALRLPLRLRSIYVLAVHPQWLHEGPRVVDIVATVTVWVITAADRRSTRVLLPEEIFEGHSNE